MIATPHTSHLPLVRQAAAAGKHVFLEKPMGLDVAECDAMIEACRAAGVRLMVAHITRFLEATRVAKALVDDGAIGTLRMISVHRILNGYPNEGWTLDPREGSAWLDWGSHGCDVIRWFAGRDPEIAFAQFTSYRRTPPAGLSGMVQFVFPDDVMSQTWMSYEVPADSWIQRARYVFTGSDGVVDLNAYGRVEVVRGKEVREAYVQPDLEASSVTGPSPESVLPGVGRGADPGVRRRGGGWARAVRQRRRGSRRDRDGPGRRAVGGDGSVRAAAARPHLVEASRSEVDPDEAAAIWW